MKTLVRRITIVVSATALSVGLLGVAAPADAAKKAPTSLRDTQWD
jgi:hypothetical protein